MQGLSGAARAAVAALALGGCSSLQMNPEYQLLTPVGGAAATRAPAPSTPRAPKVVTTAAPGPGGAMVVTTTIEPVAAAQDRDAAAAPDAREARIDYELDRVARSANAYLTVGKNLGVEDQGAGALVLGAGFYGAGVTAFNPAPKNLLAALLAAGTGNAWQSALKPGARAKVYVQGYRALDCVYSAGTALRSAADVETVLELRVEIGLWTEEAERLRRAAPSAPEAPLKAKYDLLAELVKQMSALETTLALEQNALIDAPYRVANVRRAIEDAVDKRITASAPNYEEALKILSAAAKPAGSPTAGKTNAEKNGLKSMVMAEDPVPKTLDTMLDRLPGKIERWTLKTPTRAADAYQRMGECVKLIG